MESPFVKIRNWLGADYIYRVFLRDWDVGRTILVASIGYIDKYRKNLTHQIYWILRLVPYPKAEITQKQ